MIASVFLCCTAVALPEVVVDRDNISITESCRIVIPAGTVIKDSDGNGVIQIDADNIFIEFAAESILLGNNNLVDRDMLFGVGIRVNGHRNVTLQDLRICGYKLGIWATNTQLLSIENSTLKTMYSQRLKSTPEAEDASDWLYPHHNDERPWREEYGGAIVIEKSSETVIHDVVIREGQNGIILDRVRLARIYDNDCSFLSGWGLAMWRSDSNIISRNAFDFCIRGYSHGVYNRGQDSAGILMFEQCSHNTIISNSVTHGGDGIFGFAGREAIGEVVVPGLTQVGLGCNDNIFCANDLSYAAAHGFEMTFSRRNTLLSNRFADNSICGIWGGYSQDTVIFGNVFERNGLAGYGLERGGVNIEHGSGNQILSNFFLNDPVAIHLWWDDDSKLLQLPGISSTYRGVSDNTIAGNESRTSDVFLRIRDTPGGSHITNLQVLDNVILAAKTELEIPSDITPIRTGTWQSPPKDFPVPIGRKQPFGARRSLRGRESIQMTQWGPWDHQTSLVQFRPNGMKSVQVDVMEPKRKLIDPGPSEEVKFKLTGEVELTHVLQGKSYTITPKHKNMLTPYAIESQLGISLTSRAGLFLDTQWNLTFFTWDNDTDPRTKFDAWRRLAVANTAMSATSDSVSLKFGHSGPRSLKLNDLLTTKGPGNDHFGMLATATVTIPKGAWRFITRSDDGVRLKVNGTTIIENWTWHGPTKNEGLFQQNTESPAHIEIEYFEIDGFAVFDLEILPSGK